MLQKCLLFLTVGLLSIFKDVEILGVQLIIIIKEKKYVSDLLIKYLRGRVSRQRKPKVKIRYGRLVLERAAQKPLNQGFFIYSTTLSDKMVAVIMCQLTCPIWADRLASPGIRRQKHDKEQRTRINNAWGNKTEKVIYSALIRCCSRVNLACFSFVNL